MGKCLFFWDWGTIKRMTAYGESLLFIEGNQVTTGSNRYGEKLYFFDGIYYQGKRSLWPKIIFS